jgi:hypothetical protein
VINKLAVSDADVKFRHGEERVCVSHLLHQSYRNFSHAKHETLANLTVLSASLAGQTVVIAGDELEVIRSLFLSPHEFGQVVGRDLVGKHAQKDSALGEFICGGAQLCDSHRKLGVVHRVMFGADGRLAGVPGTGEVDR